MTLAKSAGDLDQGVSCGGGEKHLDSEHRLTVFVDGLNVECPTMRKVVDEF